MRTLALLLATALWIISGWIMSGCARKSKEKKQTSLGVDDGVEGFIFNFDQRKEIAELVRFRSRNEFPVRVEWYYDPAGNLHDGETVQGKKPYVTEDPEKIRDIYYALSNTIILGVATSQSDQIKYYIRLTLPDGEICSFDFVTENTIRLSNQNYVAESDGSLWSSLTPPDKVGQGDVSSDPDKDASQANEAVTESADEALTESAIALTITEAADEALTEASDEALTETSMAEAVTEAAGGAMTGPAPAESVTEAADEAVTEAADEAVTEAADEAVTEAADETVTEAVTEVGQMKRPRDLKAGQTKRPRNP